MISPPNNSLVVGICKNSNKQRVRQRRAQAAKHCQLQPLTDRKVNCIFSNKY